MEVQGVGTGRGGGGAWKTEVGCSPGKKIDLKKT